MRWNYMNFSVADLRGDTLADYLVNVEADFEIVEAGNEVYAEPAFPVAELARELSRWISVSEREPTDFCFASLSFEDPGAVRILRGAEGWLVGSALTPGELSSPQQWQELTEGIIEFIGHVRRDLEQVGIDTAFVLGDG
ncbi:hypothetical protein [Streptomyces nanshensis]|uniref:DUF7878 domain-containing protein n=1 Tax=Streptomyces nanshensis TaxID=518642 RepID=A0A1E7L2Z7_9ACTN|nr:hypothetical protein [Streptomyces nanshensis]OEV10576.1 hypothetical protein AN218_16870 [Streptomyces nanshensis]